MGTFARWVVTPAHGQSGSAVITISVRDGDGGVASDTFTLTVTGVNRDDFDGDGLSDIVFQHRDGFMAVWPMNGENSKYPPASPGIWFQPNHPGDAAWRIVGSGDFDGDKKADVLFQYTDGTLAVWYLDGVTQKGSALLNPSNPGDGDWKVVAVADFNADGYRDLLFQYRGGTLAIWYMNGINRTGSTLVTPTSAGAGWLVAAATDLNGDGKPDIIFQHTTGTLAAWFMNGATQIDSDLLNPSDPGSGWHVVGAANYGSTGQSDLVLQHDDGTLQMWFMSGVNAPRRTLVTPNNAGDGWFVAAPK